MVLRHAYRFAVMLFLMIASALTASSAAVRLSSNLASSQPVGTSIRWTATQKTGLLYQFSVAEPLGSYAVVRDYSTANSFSWTALTEGLYRVRVAIINSTYNGSTTTVVEPFQLVSRITAGIPVISSTQNPLVALYSAPPCGSKGSLHVEFGITASTAYWQATNSQACSSTQSSNFYIAGMLPSTTYQMQEVFTNGSTVIRGSVLSFTTGAVAQALPTLASIAGPTSQSSFAERVLLHGTLNTQNLAVNVPFATNLAGDVIWYYNLQAYTTGLFSYVTRPVDGGTMLMLASQGKVDDFLSEIDLAGNTIRQTDRLRINAQLTSLGYEQVVALHHEAVRFPNGQTLVLGMIQHLGTNGNQSILGDMIIALDQNLQVAWVWDAFDYLSTSRGPVLGETCEVNYGAYCPASDSSAIDWLHSNSLSYSPADHNLLLSIRDQDWVLKLDYRDGAGTGNIIWKLGAGGDFSIQSLDPYPWFSHQHDANWFGTNQVTLFDNGNTRCEVQSPCYSRGQVLQLDEQNFTATLVYNANLGVYASSLGSAQVLSNGNYEFGPGYIEPSHTSAAIELTPNGTVAFGLWAVASEYRTFRMQSLYVAPR